MPMHQLHSMHWLILDHGQNFRCGTALREPQEHDNSRLTAQRNGKFTGDVLRHVQDGIYPGRDINIIIIISDRQSSVMVSLLDIFTSCPGRCYSWNNWWAHRHIDFCNHSKSIQLLADDCHWSWDDGIDKDEQRQDDYEHPSFAVDCPSCLHNFLLFGNIVFRERLWASKQWLLGSDPASVAM